MSPCKRNAGFGLLEAIVALALFSGVGLTLFAWMNGNVEWAARLVVLEHKTRAQTLAVAFAEALDPVKQPEGRWQAEADTFVVWRSHQIGVRLPVAPLPGETHSPFEIARFAVEVDVIAPGLAQPMRLRVLRLGVWREPYRGIEE